MAPPNVRLPIRRLDPETIAQIAAGEVVERPASVVKELVENAMDARAQEVRVSLENGGLTAIEVADDGEGILHEELTLAVERHATSKLTSFEGLVEVQSLGFRGEALAAIAAVSRLTIISRPPGSNEAHGLEVEGGTVTTRLVRGRPIGTSVRVEELFFNTPARRKFLRSPVNEAQGVLQTIERLYLARPDVGITVYSDDREVARYPATQDLSEAASRVLGAEFQSHAIRFGIDLAPGLSVEGVVGHPAISRANSLGIFLSVNRRAVSSRNLAQAIRQAFRDYLPMSRFPVGVVHLTLDPHRVDVNVHPTKREVRVGGEREIADRLLTGVRNQIRAAPEAVSRPETMTLVAAARKSSRPGTVPSASPTIPTSGNASDVPPPTRPVQRLLPGAGVSRAIAPTTRAPRMTLLGSIFHLYWVAESAEGMVLVDQHAASERLLYDSLLHSGRLGHQQLVAPVRITLTARQLNTLEANRDAISSAGFSVESFGQGVYRVAAVPVYRGQSPPPEAVGELLDELGNGGRPTVPNGLVERRAASIACHSAVRAGDIISSDTMGRILEGLGELPDSSYACPHGRPIRILLSRSRVDRWFLRQGVP